MDRSKIGKAELPVMKVLRKRGELSSPKLFEGMEGNGSTLKTLLKRPVDKGGGRHQSDHSGTFSYYALVSEADDITEEQQGFLKRVFDGSKKKRRSSTL